MIAIQVVEHLTAHQLQELISLAASRVRNGGRVVFETINPKSVQALSSNYFRDITHKMPLHPDTLDYMMKLAGMRTIEVRMLSPIPEGALLQEVPLGEQLTPRWMHAMTLMNQNIRQLNAMLYGHQDFCICGRGGSWLGFLVLGARVLFTRGGADVLVNTLAKELKRRGHEVDTVELPLSMLPKESLLNQSALWRAIGLKDGAGREVDLVIATKFPTYYVSHHCKSIWLVHQHRALYDLYASNYSDISDDPRDEQFRRLIVAADAKAFNESKYIAGISQNVVDRLRGFHGIGADVLYPPLPLGNAYCCAASEPYILSVSRLCLIKRVDLLIKALVNRALAHQT